MMGIGLIKGPLKTAEKGGHGQVHAPVSIINSGVDEDRTAGGIAKEITAPKVSMQQSGWFRRENAGKGLIQPLELLPVRCIQQPLVHGQEDLRLQPLVNEKIYPIGGLRIGLGEGPHIIIVIKTEISIGMTVRTSKLLAEATQEVIAAQAFRYPFKDQ